MWMSSTGQTYVGPKQNMSLQSKNQTVSLKSEHGLWYSIKLLDLSQNMQFRIPDT
jgi:hypothetical protein